MTFTGAMHEIWVCLRFCRSGAKGKIATCITRDRDVAYRVADGVRSSSTTARQMHGSCFESSSIASVEETFSDIGSAS